MANQKLDGEMRKLKVEDIVPGAVVRMTQSDGSFPPFSDTVILGVSRPPHDDIGQVLAMHDEIKRVLLVFGDKPKKRRLVRSRRR